MPLVGSAGGVWSFLHVDDMATATVAAIESRARGVYNVVDDDPQRSRNGPLPRPRGGSEAASARSRMARKARHRRAGGGDDDGVARVVERQGEARARVAANMALVARRVRARSASLADKGRHGRRDRDRRHALRELRPLIFSIAYRMLGSASEAEDVVQESFLRLHRASAESEIHAPKAYLASVATRLSIDRLRSARVRRERYVGTWLPEPVVVDDELDAVFESDQADSLSLAFLVLLEPHAGRAGGLPAPRGVRIRLPRHRGDRGQAGGQRPADRLSRAAPRRRAAPSVRQHARGARPARRAVLRCGLVRKSRGARRDDRPGCSLLRRRWREGPRGDPASGVRPGPRDPSSWVFARPATSSVCGCGSPT